MTYTTNLELCFQQYLYGSVYSLHVTEVYKLTTIRCFCDLATQPYVGLNEYKGKWIYSSNSPLHTGRNSIVMHLSPLGLMTLEHSTPLALEHSRTVTYTYKLPYLHALGDCLFIHVIHYIGVVGKSLCHRSTSKRSVRCCRGLWQPVQQCYQRPSQERGPSQSGWTISRQSPK